VAGRLASRLRQIRPEARGIGFPDGCSRVAGGRAPTATLVLATNGSDLMYFEHASLTAGPIPKDLVVWVERQYHHI
jgi:hypothetical protein